MKNIHLLIIVCCLYCGSLIGQDRSVFYPYALEAATVNPAYFASPSYKGSTFSVQYRDYNASFAHSPKTVFGTFTMQSEKQQLTAGTRIISDSRGVQNNFLLEAIIAKTIQVDEKQWFTFAATPGFEQQTINMSKLSSNTNTEDPSLYSESNNNTHFTSGIGFLYDYNHRLKVGLSMPVLITSGQEMNTFLFGSVSYAFDFQSEQLRFEPTVYVMRYSEKEARFNVGADFFYQKRYNVGLLISPNTLSYAKVGFKIWDKVDLQYAYGFPTGNFSNIVTNTNELRFAFRI